MAKAEILYDWYIVGNENAKIVEMNSPQFIGCPINPLDLSKERLSTFDIVVMPPVSLLTNVRVTGTCCKLILADKKEALYVPLGMTYFGGKAVNI